MKPVITEARAAVASHDAAQQFIPVRSKPVGAVDTEQPVSARGSVGRGVLRLARNAAIAVAILAMVPIGLVGKYGSGYWRQDLTVNVRAKTAIAERARAYVITRDPSITPLQAGSAFNSLLNPPKYASRGFTVIEPVSRPARLWEAATITPDMFIKARPTAFTTPYTTVISRAMIGFSPQEADYVRRVAESPVWQQFEIVARAPAVDFIGGRLRVPFDPSATLAEMPIPAYSAVRELANASASRAAWYLSRNQKDSAEAALRMVVSFGFALIDNGTNVLDQLIGDVIVGHGREQLREFYTATGDASANDPALQPITPATAPPEVRVPAAQMRRYLVAGVNNPAVHRGERFEMLRRLSYSSCSTVKELLLGPGDDVRNAMVEAQHTLARYPSERALVGLATRPVTVRASDLSFSPMATIIASASSVAGVVLHNDRMAVCSLVAGQAWGPF